MTSTLKREGFSKSRDDPSMKVCSQGGGPRVFNSQKMCRRHVNTALKPKSRRSRSVVDSEAVSPNHEGEDLE